MRRILTACLPLLATATGCRGPAEPPPAVLRAQVTCTWVPAASYDALVDGLGRGTVDLAFLGGVTYARARARFGAVPLAMRDIDLAAVVGRPAGGTEIIALVEDQEVVRSVATRLLRRLGYTVHAFESAEAAIAEIAAVNGPVHLLITDVVLPGLNGRVLAERIRELRPDIAVLFTSGYTGNVLARHGVLDPGLEFLPKPYTGDSLAARVRALLDGRSEAGPGPE